MKTEADKGKKKTRRLYDRWHSMLRRCEKPNYKDYYLYGARGIAVCKEWHSFDAYVKWFFEAEVPPGHNSFNGRMELTVDRIDNDVGYCPDNCRLATRKEQANNTRMTRFIKYHNRLYSIREFCSSVGVNFHTFYSAFIFGKCDIRHRRIRIVHVDTKKLEAFLKKHAAKNPGGAK